MVSEEDHRKVSPQNNEPLEDSESGWDDSLNDEAIKAQEKKIEDEVAAQNSLVGDCVPLDNLLNEYSHDDTVYRSKISDLRRTYGTMRKSRPDGNCFFRAFGFSLFHSLLNDNTEIDRMISVANSVLDDLHGLGFSFTADDFHDVFVESLTELKEGRIRTSQQLLDHIFNESSKSDYIVVFLRLITSSHLQKNSDFFQAFIEDGLSVKEFCSHEVEPMFKESDHIHVIAITSATGVGVRINYLDRGGSAEKINVHDFPDDGKIPKIHLLYRPGHYDIIYPLSPTLNHQGKNRLVSSLTVDDNVTSSTPSHVSSSSHFGVSSSKNPRLEPVSSSTANEDPDEPSTTSTN